MTNSPLFFIMSYEYLSGLTEIYVLGGSEFRIPVHAIVMRLDFSIVPHETSTGGRGAVSVPGFQSIFAITVT